MKNLYKKLKIRRRWIATLATLHFYGNPSKNIKIIGVTGTNGKTTTTTLLHQLFRNLGYKVGLIGTVVNKIDDKSFDTERTTPDPKTLNKLLQDMVYAGCEYCFMEVSSHAIDQRRVAGLKFAGGVFTNLTHDHLDYHKNFENYFEAKKKFFKKLPSDTFALSNIDDKYGKEMIKGINAKKYFYSLKDQADFNERLETKLIGEFNAYNILAIYATAVLLGQNKNKVREEIKKLEPAPGRFVSISSSSGGIGIIDYAHTPDALENVLRTINKMKGNGKIISVFGCGGDRDKTKRPIMAKIGYDMSDILILTSDNPRTENPEAILEDMKKGIESLPQDKVQIIADRHEAIRKACSLATKGDYILIAGKGHENYQEVNGVKSHFDDMKELKKCFNL
jgi:UDP-N-acetylmuramoyl-L-alanyl-D-glutamate--2,6-diaminopimelate ligase